MPGSLPQEDFTPRASDEIGVSCSWSWLHPFPAANWPETLWAGRPPPQLPTHGPAPPGQRTTSKAPPPQDGPSGLALQNSMPLVGPLPLALACGRTAGALQGML